MRRLVIAAVLAGVVLSVLASTAGAEIRVFGRDPSGTFPFLLHADPEDPVNATIVGAGTGLARVTFQPLLFVPGPTRVTWGDGCTFDPATPLVGTCSVGCALSSASVTLGSFDDNLNSSVNLGCTGNLGTQTATIVNGGDGNDTISIVGGGQLNGGDGNDSLFSTASTDFEGGNGDDFFASTSGADLFDGAGDVGEDETSYASRTAPVTVTLDGTFLGQPDGAPGEGDRVGTVDVAGGSAADTLTGNALSNEIFGNGGNDVINGNGGNDTLFGGAGDDSLTGGSGSDTIKGEDGNDNIQAQDGVSDTITCGNGFDIANVDVTDSVSFDCDLALPPSFGGIGGFALTPTHVRTRPGRLTRVGVRWMTPRSWRTLRTVDIGLGPAGTVRFVEDGTKTGHLVLGHASGKAGEHKALSAGLVTLDLSRSRVQGSGPLGHTVDLRLALRFDASLAGRTLKVTLGATNDAGRRQRQRPAGTIRIR